MRQTFVSILTINPEVLGGKLVLAPFLLPQIPYEPAWDRTRASSLRDRLLIA